MRQDSPLRPSAGGPPRSGANQTMPSSGPVRVPGWAYPIVTLLSLLIGATAIVRGTRAVQVVTDSDLTNFFFKSADYILRGDPWHMYAVRASGLYPNYNPPLSIFLMAPLLEIGNAMGFAKNYGEQITIVSLPFSLFVPLLGFVVLTVLRRLYPEMPEAQRLLAYMLIVLSPLTWQSIATWYHLEQPMMLALLVAALLTFQRRQEGLAGVLAGLALLTRTTALIPLIALGVLLLAAGEWRSLLKLVIPTGLVAGLGMAPFFLFDRRDAMYSFVTWRGSAPIGGNSVWSVFAYGGTSGIRHTLAAVAERLDMPSVVLVVAVVAFIAVRRWHISAYAPEAWAILTIAALTVPMLSKTNWPYYYLEPFVLLVIWEFATMHDRVAGVWRWPVLTIAFLLVAATLSQYIGLQSVGALDRISVGLLEFVSMAAFAVAVWKRLQAAKEPIVRVMPAWQPVPPDTPPVAGGLPTADRSPAGWSLRSPDGTPQVPSVTPAPGTPLWPGPSQPPARTNPVRPDLDRPSTPPPTEPWPGSQGNWPDARDAWPPRPAQ